MSETVENYDGLCGIIANFISSNNQLRCHYEFGHQGPHSYEKLKRHFRITAGAICGPDPERNFIDSVIYHQDKE